jgi:hypothetical protein
MGSDKRLSEDEDEPACLVEVLRSLESTLRRAEAAGEIAIHALVA